MKFFLSLRLLILIPLLSTLCAVEVRIATFNVKLGLESSTSLGRLSTEAVLARIDADIVGLQEVTSNDLTNGYLTDLADNLGYPHVFIPVAALDTGSRVVLLSKFPFVGNSTSSIVSPPGANDVTRAAAAAVVDVPGTTNDPTIITAHLKCCFDFDDPFRRAIEMIRIRKYLEDQQLDGSDNVFVIGDFNLLGQQNLTFSSLPPGLPSTFDLGDDISFNVEYYTNPTRYFSGLGIVDPGPRQQDGVTTKTFPGSSTVLDYLLVSNSIAARNPATEVYNSNLESSFAGLPKEGTPLTATASADASDHYAVYGDFNLDEGLPFSITSNTTSLDEGGASAILTLTLDAPAPQNVDFTLRLDAPSEATLSQNLLTIPAGQSAISTNLLPLLDKISDGNQRVQISASAPGYSGTSITLTIRDADPREYRFITFGEPVTEDFNGFSGSQRPAAWADEGVSWQGADDGTGTRLGGRSYDGSLGILTASTSSFRTTLRNDTEAVIPALEIQYTGQHWRRSAGGSQDRLEAAVIRNGIPARLPLLDFMPSIEGPNGQLSPPETTPLASYLRNLNLAPGEEMALLLELVPGTPNTIISDDVFINEFHYDNTGTDAGEFIEVFVGEDFTGEIGSIAIELYNGSNGMAYGAVQNLSTFVESLPDGVGGPRLLHKQIAGIQNGSPDGIALLVNGVLKEFISYEGAFTAIDGPAAGVASSPVGVSQTSGTPEGQNSIARTGSGSSAGDFTWAVQPGAHTPGSLNAGQSLSASPQPQGIAIDDLVITPLIDSDGDLLPDAEESELGTNPFLRDSDHDGQDDFFEAILTQTNPLSPTSVFEPALSLSDESAQVTFPTLPRRSYQVESSVDLVSWDSLPTRAGTGDPITASLPVNDTLFVRVRISLP